MLSKKITVKRIKDTETKKSGNIQLKNKTIIKKVSNSKTKNKTSKQIKLLEKDKSSIKNKFTNIFKIKNSTIFEKLSTLIKNYSFKERLSLSEKFLTGILTVSSIISLVIVSVLIFS
jgi:hypothetical protein